MWVLYLSGMCGNTWIQVICRGCVTLWLHSLLSLMMRRPHTLASASWWHVCVITSLMVEQWINILPTWGKTHKFPMDKGCLTHTLVPLAVTEMWHSVWWILLSDLTLATEFSIFHIQVSLTVLIPEKKCDKLFEKLCKGFEFAVVYLNDWTLVIGWKVETSQIQ